jgi:hypothetical protein
VQWDADKLPPYLPEDQAVSSAIQCLKRNSSFEQNGMVVNTFTVSVAQTVPIRTYRTIVWNCRSHPPYFEGFRFVFTGTCKIARPEMRGDGTTTSSSGFHL